MSFINEERIGKLTIDDRILVNGVLSLGDDGSFPQMDDKLSLKADKTELGNTEDILNQAIDLKADISLLNQEVNTLNGEINLKADQTSLDALTASTNGDKQELINAINLKAPQTALDDAVSTLNTAIDLKADQTSLNGVETNLNNAINLKADQTSLDNAVSTLNSAIDLKADQTSLDNAVTTLNSAIDLKADQTALDDAVSTINTAIDLKADQTALDDAVTSINSAVGLKADQTALDDAVRSINSAVGLKADQTSLDYAVADLNTAIDLKADQTALDDTNETVALKADEATLANYATTSYVNGNFMSAPDKYDALTGLIPDGKWTSGEDYVSHRLSPYATVNYVNASTLTSGAISSLISTATTGLATTSALEVATEAIGALETQIGAIETTAVYKPVDWLTESEGFTLKEYVENKVGGETSDVVRKPTDFDDFGGDLQAYVENKTIPQPSDWANGVDELDEYVREKTQNIPDSSRIFGTTPTLQFQKSSGTFGEGSETDYSITSDPFVPFGIYRKNTDPLGVQSWEGYAFTIQNNGDVNIPKTLGLKVNNLNVAIADDHYTKAEINTKLAERAVGADVYTKVETDDLLLLKADSVSTYGKEQSDERFALKTDVATNSTAINSTILPAITALETTRASTTSPSFTGTSTFENAVVSGTLQNGSGVSYSLVTDVPDVDLSSYYTKSEVDNQIGGLDIIYYDKSTLDTKFDEKVTRTDGTYITDYFKLTNNLPMSFWKKAYIDGAGRFGVNTLAPRARLHVVGTGGYSLTSASRSWFTAGASGLGSSPGTWANDISIYGSRDIISGDHVGSQKGSFTSSDRRIKTNIVDIDDASALETLLLLKPKTYTYKDTIGRGEDPVYGFIAQEVQETLPYSTIVKNDFIPNIYEVSNISSSNVVTFTNFNTADLVGKSSQLRIKNDIGDDKDVNIVEVIDEKSLRVDEDLTEFSQTYDENGNLVSSNIVFVYGEEVDDFLNLKKEVFHAISVSSIQELHRRLEAEKTKVADLLARVEALENQ